ncbi:hypothetical protein RSOL_392520 [Rhizoctonia solani AG-3 Rhs1AP]|uniref:Uncharacterized protein n=1 Tax=Rhizoctonia solani AG-3 Rhs1AP TaxID=1086054 RepID=X8JBJ2_9AGAM|nr:hypothetical protein RSOL_392520 [Rhizoctonia solani AG-3 Rhs1AP]
MSSSEQHRKGYWATPVLPWCILKMRLIITHFHSSTYAVRHLAALRVLHNVPEGIVAIGNTRFASYYYAAQSVLNCLPLILQLISSGVLDLNPVCTSNYPIH